MVKKIAPGGSLMPAMDYRNGERGTGNGRRVVKTDGSGHKSIKDFAKRKGIKGKIVNEAAVEAANGASIFDPVLCEIAYRWFCPEGGSVLDPFAGGSVRGIVAGYLGHPYTGIDLRADQIAANEIQAKAIQPKIKPRWILGNSEHITDLTSGDYDFVFSCPPYYDLEIYSDTQGDLSALGTYDEFIKVYRNIIAQCCGMLKDNRFACFVVGDIRDKKGFYRGFVKDTITAFEDAGAKLYNEAILVNVIGSLPIRVAKPFVHYRKMGKTHQNMLVFYKGDPKQIKDQFGVIEIPDELFKKEED